MNQGTVGTYGVPGAGPPEADVALGLTGRVQGEGLPLPPLLGLLADSRSHS